MSYYFLHVLYYANIYYTITIQQYYRQDETSYTNKGKKKEQIIRRRPQMHGDPRIC